MKIDAKYLVQKSLKFIKKGGITHISTSSEHIYGWQDEKNSIFA